MKRQRSETVGMVAVAGSFLSMIGLGLWRAMRGGGLPPGTGSALADVPVGAERGDVPPTGPELQDLSTRTPGFVELDIMARAAAEEARREAGGWEPEREIVPFTRPARAWGVDSSLVAEVLAHQDLNSDPLVGWSRPPVETLPLPTYAPSIMAAGIVLFAMGIATTWYICVAGSITFAVAALRWTIELQEG